MTDHDQFSFTVTPYHDEAEPVEAPRPTPGVAYLPGALWLGAAVIAVTANFFEVVRFHSEGPGPDDNSTFSITVSYSGWGKPSYSAKSIDGFGESLNSGARWGWAFSVCAALLVIAAVWSIRPRWRTRWLGPGDLAAAGVFGLAGSVAALVLSFQPTRHQLALSDLSQTHFNWGWCWPAELIAVALGLVGWIWYRRTATDQARPVLEEITPVASSAPDSTDPQTGNWFDEARDRPGTPTDPDRSPW